MYDIIGFEFIRPITSKKNSLSINYVNILSGKKIYNKNIINCIKNK